jgi:hypothetical protein
MDDRSNFIFDNFFGQFDTANPTVNPKINQTAYKPAYDVLHDAAKTLLKQVELSLNYLKLQLAMNVHDANNVNSVNTLIANYNKIITKMNQLQ